MHPNVLQCFEMEQKCVINVFRVFYVFSKTLKTFCNNCSVPFQNLQKWQD